MADYRERAYHIRDVMKVNCVPLSSTKTPKMKWRHLQSNLISDKEIEKYCEDCLGLAVLTGLKISPVYCLDFDLSKLNPKGSVTPEGFFEAFMERIPSYIKSKFVINATSSGVGRHIWLRTDTLYRTSKITHRLLTVQEVWDRYNKMRLSSTLDEDALSTLILGKPYECIVESRGSKSYAVFEGAKYKRLHGKDIQKFTDTEVNLILDTLYSMDCFFHFPKTYSGKKEDYRIINQFNDIVDIEDIMDCVIATGAFTDAGVDGDGNRKFKSITTSAAHSGYIFRESKNLYSFSHNTLVGQGTLMPHEVFKKCKNFSEDELLEFISDYIDCNYVLTAKNVVFNFNKK